MKTSIAYQWTTLKIGHRSEGCRFTRPFYPDQSRTQKGEFSAFLFLLPHYNEIPPFEFYGTKMKEKKKENDYLITL